MTFLGMSYVEILVVALVAFVFMGPDRMAATAKKLGKLVKEVRGMASELPSIEDLDLSGSRSKGAGGSGGAGTGSAAAAEGGGTEDEDEPVAFRAAGAAPVSVGRVEKDPEDES